MNKQELINQINHTLLDKDTIANDENHPFHDFTIEEMEETMEDFTKFNERFTEKPSYIIYNITSYLMEKDLISFDLEEKQSQDDSWFEALIYEKVGIKNGEEIVKTIIWDGSVYLATENFDQFIELLAEIQADIDSVTLFNSVKE